jgi:hypothetical protein
MGVRTRGLDIAIAAKRQVADAVARAEAKAAVERCRIGWVPENQSVTPPARTFPSVNHKIPLT